MQNDPCIYFKDTYGEAFYISVHVDDIILARKSESKIKQVKNDLSIEQNEQNGSVWIGQHVYTETLLKKFGMEDCKPVSTPVDISLKLTQATDEDNCIDQQRYQSAIGRLMYLSVSTRPDISYTISYLARFSSKANKRTLDCPEMPTQIPEAVFPLLYLKEGAPPCL